MDTLRIVTRIFGLFRWCGFGFCTIDPRTHLLTFTRRDLLFSLLLNGLFLSGSWYFFYTVIITFWTANPPPKDEEATKGSETDTAVSMIYFFTEQFANGILIPLTLWKQRKFLDICNRVHQVEEYTGQQKETVQGLRNLFIFTLVSLLFFGSFFIIICVWTSEDLINTWFHFIALLRPFVSDCVNLQFMGIVLLIKGRIRRVAVALEEDSIPLSKVHQLLTILCDCVQECSSQYSTIFIIQSLRIMMTLDNSIYQLIQLINSGILFQYIILAILLGNVVIYSLGVYIATALICQQTQTEFQRLSNICDRRSSLGNSEGITMHLVSIKNQRHGHGFGFYAFGLMDMDRKGLFGVRIEIFCN